MSSTDVSTPAWVEVRSDENLTDLLVERAALAADHVAFDVRRRVADDWTPVTTAAFHAEVLRVAGGLIGAGVQAGDCVAIMAATRYEWAVTDLACWFAGAVVVPVYETSALSQVVAVLADSGVRLGIAGTSVQAELLREAFHAAGLDPLGIWSMDDDSGHDLEDLVARGRAVPPSEVEARRRVARADSPATIVYTSGTTAAPKGAVITHGNLIHQVRNIAAEYADVLRSDGNTIIFLPLAHVLARGLQLICLANGMRIAHLSDPREVVPSLPRLRPTFLVVVPRVLQKVQAAAAAAAAQKHLSLVWASAQRTAVRWGACADDGARPGWRLRAAHALYDKVFYARLRRLLGGQIEYMLSGAAALDADLCRFFRGAGIPVIEGYGLTETTAPLTGNRPGSICAGTVGPPMPGLSVRIAPDGEVLAKGPGVFAGYRDPAANEGAFVDGWFRTGDLGAFDDQDRLILHGRCKDVIVTSGGKTVSPEAWESVVEQESLVAHAVLVGEGKPYLGGLIVLDPESVAAWAAREGVTSLGKLSPPGENGLVEVDEPRLLAVIAHAVEAANARVARSEQARRFTLLIADLSERGGFRTPTLKLKRSVFVARVQHIIEKLYSNPGRKS